MSLDYKTDHPVRFVSGDEAKSPDGKFDWALQEDRGGSAWRTTLYPWRWTSHFAINGLSLVTDYGVSSSLILENEVGEYGVSRYVSGNLVPKPNARGFGPWYSFLGSDRRIVKLGLCIHPWDKEVTHARLEGCVGFAYEHDFSQKNAPDYLNIEIYLPSVEFDTIVTKIENGLVAEASLSVSGVSGFYAGWDPGISTHEIKVIWPGLEIINGESSEAEEQILTQGDGISGFNIRFQSALVASLAEDQNESLFDELLDESSPTASDEPISDPDHLENTVWMMARLNSLENKLAWIAVVSTITAGALVWILVD